MGEQVGGWVGELEERDPLDCPIEHAPASSIHPATRPPAPCAHAFSPVWRMASSDGAPSGPRSSPRSTAASSVPRSQCCCTFHSCRCCMPGNMTGACTARMA